jgi:hypothetical protein
VTSCSPKELLSSLEKSDDEVAAAWASELERRSREVAEGRVQTAAWDTVRTTILKELKQLAPHETERLKRQEREIRSRIGAFDACDELAREGLHNRSL